VVKSLTPRCLELLSWHRRRRGQAAAGGPGSGDDPRSYAVRISQDHHELFVSLFSFGLQFLDYIEDTTHRVFPPPTPYGDNAAFGSYMLNVVRVGPFRLWKKEQMRRFCSLVLAMLVKSDGRRAPPLFFAPGLGIVVRTGTIDVSD